MKLFKNNVLGTIAYYAKLLFQTKRSFYIAYLFTIILNGAVPITNVIFGKYLVQNLVDKSFNNFLVFAGIIVLVNLISSVIRNRCSKFMSLIYDILQTEFDLKIADKITRIELETIETAEFQNKLEKAKVGISWYSGGIAGVAGNVSSFISGMITIIGTIAIIAQFSILVVLFVILTSILNIVITALAQKRDVRFRKRLVTVNRKLGYFLNIFKDQKISKDVRLYKADDLIESRVNHFLDTEWKEERKNTKFGNKIRVWIDVINYINQTFLYIYFALQTVRKVIDISSFTMYLNAGITFYSGIIGVTTQIIEIEKNASFLEEYKIFMQLPERKRADKELISLPEKIDSIEFVDVSFRYPQSKEFALNNVSVTIKWGEKLSLIGLNGAGKTTFIKLLCGLYKPTSGEILLNGVSIAKYNEEDYKKAISVVFQDYQIFAFSIAENIFPDKFDKEKLYDVLKFVGLDQKVSVLPEKENTNFTKEFDESGIEFSGGEKQRLAIARALYKKSSVMVLDEPTASLDPVAEYEVFKLFSSGIKDKTAIFISHRLSSCLLCDRIILFDAGRTKSSGCHKEMLGDALYKEMWEAQSKYYI